MKTFAKIVASALFLFAYAPAFAHGSGYSGMNGMEGGNSHNTMTTNTLTQHTSTRTGTNDHTFGNKVFLRTDERILMHKINRLKAEILKLQTASNSTRVSNLTKVLSRLDTKLFRIRGNLGQVS
jgi:hypothetical protein